MTLQEAYAEMKRRGWGFVSVGNPNPGGFGDPATKMTVVGPYDGVLVQVLACDTDPVEAVKKAIAKSKTGGPNGNIKA